MDRIAKVSEKYQRLKNTRSLLEGHSIRGHAFSTRHSAQLEEICINSSLGSEYICRFEEARSHGWWRYVFFVLFSIQWLAKERRSRSSSTWLFGKILRPYFCLSHQTGTRPNEAIPKPFLSTEKKGDQRHYNHRSKSLQIRDQDSSLARYLSWCCYRIPSDSVWAWYTL